MNRKKRRKRGGGGGGGGMPAFSVPLSRPIPRCPGFLLHPPAVTLENPGWPVSKLSSHGRHAMMAQEEERNGKGGERKKANLDIWLIDISMTACLFSLIFLVTAPLCPRSGERGGREKEKEKKNSMTVGVVHVLNHYHRMPLKAPYRSRAACANSPSTSRSVRGDGRRRDARGEGRKKKRKGKEGFAFILTVLRSTVWLCATTVLCNCLTSSSMRSHRLCGEHR